MAEDLRVIKKALRRDLKAKREAMGEDLRLAKSEQIVERIKQSKFYKQAKKIFVFSPIGAELRIDLLFDQAEAQDKTLAFPVTFAKGRMEAFVPEDRHKMQADSMGIKSPDPEKDKQLDPQEIDLLLVPLLGFDRSKQRIGYGGGFYDRYIARLSPHSVTVGVAFAEQEVAEIPTGRFDKTLDYIFTDKEIIE